MFAASSSALVGADESALVASCSYCCQSMPTDSPFWSRFIRTTTRKPRLAKGRSLRAGGPVVELGVGTGRIAVPLAVGGVRVIGIDSSRGMLEVCARRAALAGVELDLR